MATSTLKRLRVLVVGETGVGKTSLLMRYESNQFPRTVPRVRNKDGIVILSFIL